MTIPAAKGDGGTGGRGDPIRLAIQLAVFLVSFFTLDFVLDGLLRWVAQDLAGPMFAELFSGLGATWLALRIYEGFPVIDVGLWWNRFSGDNLLLGLLGGLGAACLVLTLPLVSGAAAIVRVQPGSAGGMAFALLCMAAGSVGEELLFRGYAFQLLVARLGPWAAVVPFGVLFGLLHAANPDASRLGIVNTAAFGVLFGYAYLRSHDLWLPIGLHFGWNVTLPLFGANLSGIKIFKEITGHEMAWRAGSLWSGGEYGPEASLLTSIVFIPLFLFLWKGPIRRQVSPLTDPPAEGAICESAPPSPS
jgi:uncharacterized protein